MDYLFLHRDKRTFTSERQKNLLFRAAHIYWEQKFAGREPEKARKVDCEIYKYVLYYLEVRQVFLDPEISLKKLSGMIETNQTYLSNVINRYFGCHLKDLLNKYRVEYAKETAPFGQIFTRGDTPILRIPVAKHVLRRLQENDGLISKKIYEI